MLRKFQVSVTFLDSSDNEIAETRPGSDVKVSVATDPGSMVGLLSVDESILLLGGSGNDITQSMVSDSSSANAKEH